MKEQLVWAEVDLNAIAFNVKQLKGIVGPQTRLMTVVKADGYGHGAVEVAKVAIQSGAEALGVARLHEAIELREANVKVPILIFGYTFPERAHDLAVFRLTQTLFSYESAKMLADAAVSLRKRIKVHIKVDTGMGRVGMTPYRSSHPVPTRPRLEEVAKEIKRIGDLPGLELEGVYTHFATADHLDRSYAGKQLELFQDILRRLRRLGMRPVLAHTANSAATIDLPESHLDMVRTGIATYGLQPSDEPSKRRVDLKPALQLKTKVIQVKKVPPRFKVSYGCTFETRSDTRIATLPIGYADGLDRRLSSQGHALVRGESAPIIGRICMDLTMLDVGHISDVEVGDEVVIIGAQEDRQITAAEIASRLNTIHYEIVSTITARVPRFYLR